VKLKDFQHLQATVVQGTTVQLGLKSQILLMIALLGLFVKEEIIAPQVLMRKLLAQLALIA
jgi:hypothetical protein